MRCAVLTERVGVWFSQYYYYYYELMLLLICASDSQGAETSDAIFLSQVSATAKPNTTNPPNQPNSCL